MDSIMRGTTERFIDSLLENEWLLENVKTLFEKGLEYPREKVEDAMFGYFVGRIIQFIDTTFQRNYERPPNEPELLEFGQLIVRRAMEIKSKVKITVNK